MMVISGLYLKIYITLMGWGGFVLDFNSRGVLEAGFHPCTLADLEFSFVNKFPESQTRKDIFMGYIGFISKLKQFGISCEQWIDGSFVTSKIDPNDIDFVSIIDKYVLDSLPKLAKQELKEMFNPTIAKTKYKCDAYLLIKVPHSSSYYNSNYIPYKAYWRGHFGFDRFEQPKGILKIQIF